MSSLTCVLGNSAGQGGNFIDTAEVYPVPVQKEYIGKSEEFIGNWMKARDCRKDLVLATKVPCFLQSLAASCFSAMCTFRLPGSSFFALFRAYEPHCRSVASQVGRTKCTTRSHA